MRLDAQVLGESALIERIAARCTQSLPTEVVSVVRGVGDDTAVLQAGGQTLLWTADMLIEGVHFRLDWMDAASLGWKALAVNLSDIAAMGGEPIGALLSIALPPERTGAWFDAFLDGFLECAHAHHASLIGGDTNRADRVVIDVSVLGRVDGAPVLRSGVQVGDWLMVTGALGGSRAGLESLFAGQAGAVDLTPHFRPTPRLQAGKLAQQSGATAMMDLSDGLAADLPKLLRASGKGAVVYTDKVPVHPVALQWAKVQRVDPTKLALLGGEDYELLITAPPAVAERMLAQMPAATGVALSVIGEVIAEPELWLESPDGRRDSFDLSGWDHFAE